LGHLVALDEPALVDEAEGARRSARAHARLDLQELDRLILFQRLYRAAQRVVLGARAAHGVPPLVIVRQHQSRRARLLGDPGDEVEVLPLLAVVLFAAWRASPQRIEYDERPPLADAQQP